MGVSAYIMEYFVIQVDGSGSDLPIGGAGRIHSSLLASDDPAPRCGPPNPGCSFSLGHAP